MIATSFTPSKRGNGTSRSAGFTLIELLIVITVIALLSAVAVRQFGPPEGLERRRSIQDVRTTLSKARMDALLSGRSVTVDAGTLPSGYSFVSTGGAVLPSVTFYPDSSASDAAVARGAKVQLKIEWLSGYVHAPYR